MEYSDTKINNTIAARIYYTKFGKQIYIVDNSTGEELARIELVNGVDSGRFLSIISNKSVSE